MAYDRGNIEPRKKNALDNTKLGLSAPSPAEGKWAKFNFQFFNNLARLVIYSNNPADENERHGGRINLKIPVQTMMLFIQLLVKAIQPDTPRGWKDGLDCLETRFKDNKPSEKPMLEATIWVGKDDEGVIWTTVAHWDKSSPRIKFPFGNTIFNVLKHGDGTPFENEEASKLWVMAYVDTLLGIVPHLAVTEYQEPKPREDRSGGGGNRGSGGGYSRGGSGGGGAGNRGAGGGRSESYEEVDSDIPF